MRYRQLDPDGDYVFGYAPNFLINTPQTVAQAVRTRLRLFTGEWFLDTREGLDLANILGYGTQTIRDQEIRNRILGTPGVVAITAYASQVVGRAYAVQVTLDTIYGSVTISEVL